MDCNVTYLGDLSIDGGKYGIAAPAVEYDPQFPAYLRISDINDDGTLNTTDRKSVADPSAKNYMLKRGDIVFARTGGSTGRNYYYDERDGNFAFAGFLIKFSLDPTRVNPRFIKYYTQSKPYWNWIRSFNTGSTRGNINAKTLANMPIPLPSQPVQNAIVSICDSISEKIRLNNRLNGYLAALGETMATRCSNEADGTLDDICSQSKETVSLEAAQLETYVSTENLLPNKAGLQLSAGLPTSGKVTRYRKGDTLVANIRPYFKKIWYATDEGTCSGDVIVFRANDARYAPYVFFSLCRDEFFEYVMLGAKGTKMPRGDKKQMMTFPICTNCNSTDLQLLHELASMIGTNHAESRQLMRLRDTLLPKLMSGEIDVSKVDLTQLNSHLAQIRKLNDAPLATTDLGFRFDRSHYTPLLYNPSSSQQQ